jgi:putative oxidoreductase
MTDSAGQGTLNGSRSRIEGTQMHLGLFLIHVGVGLLIAAHGSQKLFGLFGGHGLEGTGGMMESFGLVPGRRMALGAGVTELVGGLLLALGLLVPLAAALIAAMCVVAARTAYAGRGLWHANGGWEYVLVLATVAVGLAFNGAGQWSLDHAIGWDVSGFWWGIGAAVVALIGATAVLTGARGRSMPSQDAARQAGPVAEAR